MPECVLLCEGDPITRQRWLAQATEIFFATAYTSNFPSEDEKYSFWMRWFGSYAGTYPDAFVLALDDKGNVIGYFSRLHRQLFRVFEDHHHRHRLLHAPLFRRASRLSLAFSH